MELIGFRLFNFQYDAIPKLLKLQGNCAKTQGSDQTSNANNDIFRKVGKIRIFKTFGRKSILRMRLLTFILIFIF